MEITPLVPVPLRTADVLSQLCPSRPVLQHMTNRWGSLVLIVLLDGRQRFSELRRRIGGISERMRAQTLHDLEADGIVLRTAHPVVPPHVDYELTPLGREGAALVKALGTWVQDNLAGLKSGPEVTTGTGGRQDTTTPAI